MSEGARKIICLRCPRGCEITVKENVEGKLKITGNACSLGIAYAKSEIQDPRRVLTTTVKARRSDGKIGLVAVWTPDPVQKDKITELAADLRKIELTAPVRRGDKIIENWRGLGVDVETSGELE